MKKLLVVLVVLLFLLSLLTYSSGAFLGADKVFCERQGYKLGFDDNLNEVCIFDDGKSCLTYEFRSGKCGSEYRKELPCVKEGEMVFNFDKCCKGLEPYFGPQDYGHDTCQKVSIQERIDELLYHHFFLTLIVLFFALLIIGFVFYTKFKKKK